MELLEKLKSVLVELEAVVNEMEGGPSAEPLEATSGEEEAEVEAPEAEDEDAFGKKEKMAAMSRVVAKSLGK